MSRIESVFATQKKALIPYITAGDPNPDITVAIMHSLVTAGADIIELGMPFSDPTADGIVIQHAHERALAAGTTLTKIFEIVREFRKTNNTTPVVLMGYINPIEIIGYKSFITEIKNAGVDGVLIVDLPLEEGEDFFAQLKTERIDPIFLATATTSDERLAKIAKASTGFLYYVSSKGVTGAQQLNYSAIENKVATLKQLTKTPIAVGFGIRDAESAKQIAKIADGVIVGSALISVIEKNSSDVNLLLEEVAGFLKGIKYVCRVE